MNKQIFTTCLLAFFFVAGTSSGSDRYLIVSECVPEQDTCGKIELIRYSFVDGYLQTRVKLDILDVKDVRFDPGENRIIRDRYVISHWGDIFDLKKSKLLHDGIGIFIGVDGSKVVYKVEKVDVEGFFVYDLSTDKYNRMKLPGIWSLPGKIAPDKQKSMSIDKFGQGAAYLHDLDGSKKTCASGLHAGLSRISSEIGKAPLLWIDNATVLTQTSNGKLILLKTNGTRSPVVDIPIDEVPHISPSLTRGPSGEILYYCGNYVYAIDPENREYSVVKWMPAGNGFDIELNVKSSRGKRIRYHGKVIGEYWCLPSSVTTAEGHIALEYGEVGSSLGYPDGVVVWSSESRKWTQLPVRFIEKLIGWTTW